MSVSQKFHTVQNICRGVILPCEMYSIDYQIFYIQIQCFENSICFILLHRILSEFILGQQKEIFVNRSKVGSHEGLVWRQISVGHAPSLADWPFDHSVHFLFPKCILSKKIQMQKKSCLKNCSSKLILGSKITGPVFSTREKRLLFKLRSRTLYVKCYFPGKYGDLWCISCGLFQETQGHLLQCPEINKKLQYLNLELSTVNENFISGLQKNSRSLLICTVKYWKSEKS